MDDPRFTVAWRSGRRGALAGLLFGVTAVISRDPYRAAGKRGKKKGKRKRRDCPECECPPPETCPAVAFCADKIDGTDCDTGKKCSGGICAPEPDCAGNEPGETCTVDGDCCSDFCQGNSTCACSGELERCHVDGDCCTTNPAGLACVAFVCVQT